MVGLEYTARLGFFSRPVTYRVSTDALELQDRHHQDRIDFQQFKSIRLYQVRKFGVSGQTSALVWRCRIQTESGRNIILPQDSFVRVGLRENRGLSFRYFVNALIARASERNPQLSVLQGKHGQKRTRSTPGRFLIHSFNILRLIRPSYLEAIGSSLFRLLGPWLSEHRVGRANLAMAFPDKSESEIEQILRGVWDNYGRVCTGILTLDSVSKSRASIEAGDKIVLSEATRRELAQYRRDRKPRLIFSAHLANWEVLAPVATALGVDLVVPVRRQHFGPVSALLNRARSEASDIYIPIAADAPGKLKSAIDRGACVAVMVDQHDANGIKVTFFERTCTVNPLFARLARRLEWPILGLRAVRLPDGRICMDMIGPLERTRDSHGQVDAAATMQTCMRAIEDWVREHPEQWMWLHRLWRGGARRF
jgi:KDO2-lipid IV(A) lauroyltransferase